MSDEADVVNIKEAKTKPKTEKKPKKGQDLIQDEIIWMLHKDDPTRIPHELREFPHTYITVAADSKDRPMIFEVDKTTNTARISSKEKVAGQIAEWFVNKKMNSERFPYSITNAGAREIVEAWLFCRDAKRKDPPKAVGYLSDPELVMKRLNFDPIQCENMDQLEWLAPTWREIVGRIQNPDGFCGRIGSIMHMEADRKQAIWISGPKDSGKSQIALQLKSMIGSESGGAFVTVSDTDLKDQFIKAELVGKRVCVMNEVSPTFINSEEFKSITGDDYHRIRPLGQQGYFAKLNTLLFFFSNNDPETQSKKELFERLIYCRINPLPDNVDIIGQVEYQKKLTEEQAGFMGYCEHVYSLYAGVRLPNDMTELIDVVAGKEDEPEGFFQRHFVAGDNERITSERYYKILGEYAGGANKKWYHNYIKRTHIKERAKGSVRSNRKIYYVGFRERRPGEVDLPDPAW
jgi:energy-coupling factor transporter ATP-binding protein EcfA2